MSDTTKLTELIKKDLDVDFIPKFQGLNKAAPMPSAGGSKPPSGPSATSAPAMPKTPEAKKPSAAPKNSMMSKPKMSQASGSMKTGTPNIPTGSGMKKDQMNPETPEARYHIYHKGHKLTQDHETVTISDVNKQYGGVKSLEGKGFLLVEHKPKPAQQPKKGFFKNEEIYAEVMGGYRPQFMGDMKDLAKNEPGAALAALPYELAKKANVGKIIVGEHIPNVVNPPPKSKKLDDKDEGSGGDVKKEEIPEDKKKVAVPANKVIKPTDSKKVNKCGDISKEGMMESGVNVPPTPGAPLA